MTREMSWLPINGNNQDTALHLRIAPHQPWKPYTSCPEYAVPDHPVPGGSKGFATYQKLRLQGWNLVPTHQAARSHRYV